jgi:membrane AbrB-like protein
VPKSIASPFARVVITLAIGALGGALFAWIGLPAPWLAGSMIAVTAAVLAGLPTAIYNPARIAVFILLGVQIGGSISHETLQRMANWPGSLVVLAATVAAVTASGYGLFRGLYKWDRPTALFSSVPGALSLTLVLADEARADMPRVTIVQCIRLFFLVAVLPSLIGLGTEGGAIAASNGASMAMRDALILVSAGSLGGFMAQKAKLPAGLILGSLVASAAVRLAGLVSGPLTNLLLFPGYVILGTMIGVRFQGFERRLVARLLWAGVVGFVLAMVVAFAGAFAAHEISGVPLSLTLVAFAPGGLEAMTIMAFALNLDPAYVGGMQIARYVAISLVLPLVGRWFRPAEKDRA